MKRLGYLILAAIILQGTLSVGFGQSGQPQQEVMTNASVIELVKLGLGEAVIIQKMRQSERRFDTSNAGLAQLKGAKVSDSIIMEMMNPGGAANGSSGPTTSLDFNSASAGNQNDPMSAHEPGIYLMDKSIFVEMNPSVFQGTKASLWGRPSPMD